MIENNKLHSFQIFLVKISCNRFTKQMVHIACETPLYHNSIRARVVECCRSNFPSQRSSFVCTFAIWTFVLGLLGSASHTRLYNTCRTRNAWTRTESVNINLCVNFFRRQFFFFSFSSFHRELFAATVVAERSVACSTRSRIIENVVFIRAVNEMGEGSTAKKEIACYSLLYYSFIFDIHVAAPFKSACLHENCYYNTYYLVT